MSKESSLRDFLRTVSLTAAALGLGGAASHLAGRAWALSRGPDALKILVLGGTGQTGPHLVRDLLGRGHTVTLFNRGNRAETLFPEVECLIGDRALDASDGLDALRAEVAGGRRCMEEGLGGTFNVVGPHPRRPLTMRGLRETYRDVTGSDASFVWADAGFLAEHGVGPWMDMPNWLPVDGEYAGFQRRNVGKAVAAGLAFRPLAETIRDTLAWIDGLDDERRTQVTGRAGINAEQEADVLAAWHVSRG